MDSALQAFGKGLVVRGGSFNQDAKEVRVTLRRVATTLPAYEFSKLLKGLSMDPNYMETYCYKPQGFRIVVHPKRLLIE